MDVCKIKQQTLQHLPDLLCVQVQEGSKLQKIQVQVGDVILPFMDVHTCIISRNQPSTSMVME